jgi:hypothetical protein
VRLFLFIIALGVLPCAFFLFAMGCATKPALPDPTVRPVSHIVKCLQQQVDYFGDLCAEAQGVALLYKEEEAYFYGMICGLQSVAICLDLEQPKE